MKRMSRILAALLSLCIGLSILSASASAAEGYIIGPRTVTFTSPEGDKRVYLEYMGEDLATFPQGSNVILTGMVDYNAVYNDGTNNYIGYNTTYGTWYICLGSYSVEAFQQMVPNDGSIEKFLAYGTYTGPLAANNLPVVDVQQGEIQTYRVGETSYVDYTMTDVMPYFQRQVS